MVQIQKDSTECGWVGRYDDMHRWQPQVSHPSQLIQNRFLGGNTLTDHKKTPPNTFGYMNGSIYNMGWEISEII